MKKTLGLSFVLIISVFALMGMGGSPQNVPAAGQDYALINVADVYANSRVGIEGVAMLEAFQAEAMQLLEDIQADMLLAQQAGDIEAEQQYNMEMQSLLYTAQDLLDQEQTRLGALINDFLLAQMEVFRQNKGLKAIFTGEALQAYDPALDITAEATEFLNAQSFDLGTPPLLERQLAPYQPAEAPAAVESPDSADSAVAPEADAETPAAEATPENAPEIAPETAPEAEAQPAEASAAQ